MCVIMLKSLLRHFDFRFIKTTTVPPSCISKNCSSIQIWSKCYYQVSWRAIEPLPRHGDLTVFNVEAVAILDFKKFEILTIDRLKGTKCIVVYQISQLFVQPLLSYGDCFQNGSRRSLWSPYVIGQTIIFSSCFFLISSSSFFSSPNVSGRRLDVYHTLAHGVALVRI